jgi:hypothetical protein
MHVKRVERWQAFNGRMITGVKTRDYVGSAYLTCLKCGESHRQTVKQRHVRAKLHWAKDGDIGALRG